MIECFDKSVANKILLIILLPSFVRDQFEKSNIDNSFFFSILVSLITHMYLGYIEGTKRVILLSFTLSELFCDCSKFDFN